MKKTAAIARLLIFEIFRKKDFYVVFALTALILFYAARIPFYNAAHAYRYLLDIGLFLSLLFASFLTAALAAGQFPREAQAHTLHVLLAKPVSRAQFVLGKFLGSFAAGSLVMTVFFAASVFFVLMRSPEISWVSAAQALYLFCLALMMLSAAVTLLSFFMTPAANTAVSLILFLLLVVYGPLLHRSIEPLSGFMRAAASAAYGALPHFGFFDMRQRFVHGWPPVSPGLLLFLTAYAAAYTAFLLGLACAAFRRKNIP